MAIRVRRAARLTAVAALVGLGLAESVSAVNYTFPSVNIPSVTPTETLVPLNVAGAPVLVFDQYTLTVNWSAVTPPPNDPFSTEARMRLLSGATPLVGGLTTTSGIAANSGAGNNNLPTTLTWTGDLNAPYTGGSPLSVGARQTFGGSVANWQNVSLTVSQAVIPTGPNYQMDDGTAEDSIGVTGPAGTFDMIWMNKFAVQAGGEQIEHVQVAFGNPANTSTGLSNGMPVTVLLYEDVNGGSPTDAVLKTSVNGTVQNLNSNTFVDFDIPDTVVTGTMLVGALMRGLSTNNAFVAGIDETDPDFNNRSFLGFTTATTTPPSPLNENNLGSMGANFGATDAFGLPGNFLIRATGSPIPEPAALGAVALAGLATVARRRRHQ